MRSASINHKHKLLYSLMFNSQHIYKLQQYIKFFCSASAQCTEDFSNIQYIRVYEYVNFCTTVIKVVYMFGVEATVNVLQ